MLGTKRYQYSVRNNVSGDLLGKVLILTCLLSMRLEKLKNREGKVDFYNYGNNQDQKIYCRVFPL